MDVWVLDSSVVGTWEVDGSVIPSVVAGLLLVSGCVLVTLDLLSVVVSGD